MKNICWCGDADFNHSGHCQICLCVEFWQEPRAWEVQRNGTNTDTTDTASRDGDKGIVPTPTLPKLPGISDGTIPSEHGEQSDGTETLLSLL